MDLIPGQVTKGFPVSYSSKESACQDTRDVGLILGLGRSPTVGNGKLHQYSCLQNPMDRGAWRATLQGAAESWTQLNDRPGKAGNEDSASQGKKKRSHAFQVWYQLPVCLQSASSFQNPQVFILSLQIFQLFLLYSSSLGLGNDLPSPAYSNLVSHQSWIASPSHLSSSLPPQHCFGSETHHFSPCICNGLPIKPLD